MPVNFQNSKGQFTVCDQVLAGRNPAHPGFDWTFQDFDNLHQAASGANIGGILVGSPDLATIRSWYSNSGLKLYTNP
jgi:hypothetical protein